MDYGFVSMDFMENGAALLMSGWSKPVTHGQTCFHGVR